MLQMKALKHTVEEEGELFPGDLFFPGYFHNRATGVFNSDNPIAWTTPRIRAHQLATSGVASLVAILEGLEKPEVPMHLERLEETLPLPTLYDAITNILGEESDG